MDKHVTIFQKTTHFLFVLLLFSTLSTGKTYASNPNWIKSTVNGNFYTLTPSLNWTDAEAWSREWGGHLVTLRSWSEESWIKERFGSNQYFWIGLNVIGYEHSKENFYWSSGEPVVYSNWCEGEPNNYQGIEDAVVMNFDNDCNGLWNDLPSGAKHHGVAEIMVDDELGLVLETSGEVSITGSAPTTKQGDGTKKGDLIRIGDLIKTHMNSLLKAAFPATQGSRNIEIYPESEVRIAEASSSSETTLEFFMGKIQSKIEGLPEGYYFEVTTGQAICGVRGTEFIVEGDETYTKITVLEGSVEVTTPDGTHSVTVNKDYWVQATTEGLGDPYPVGEEPGYFAGGSGTEADPWQIETADHLDHVRHFLGEEHQDKHFKQIADIDLGGSPWNEGEGWVPIGTADSTFYGHYDGSGKEISNMYINRDTNAYQGLFGVNNGIISNLGVVHASITDNGSRAGLLIGLNNFGTIDNCYTSGTIQSDHEAGRIGGLAGWNYHIIKDSHSTASVSTSGNYTGGLIGVNYEGSIIHCFATGEVHTELGQTGGLVGYNQEGAIIACHATGRTIGENYIGGLVGVHIGSSSIIENSYSTADVTGHDYTGVLVGFQRDSSRVINSWSEGRVTATGNFSGGLVGYCADHGIITKCYSASEVHADGNSAGGLCGAMESNAIIENSYATGAVSGLERTGGLVGWADSSQIINAYSVGYVSSETGINTGGFTGGGSETEIVYSFWDTNNSGQVTSAGGEGKNTMEMISQNTFTNWNFNTIWSIDENITYPYLQWQLEPRAHNYPAGITTISAHAGANGSIAPSGEVIVEYGQEQVFTITPDEGFCVAYIRIDGAEIDLAADTNWNAESGQYTFMDVTGSYTIEVGFIVKTYAIVCTPNNEDHGTVSGGGEYNHFEQVTLTATPATGYHFVHWTENGEVVSTSEEYTFTAEENRNLVAHFAINTYLITATAGKNGSISPAEETEVEHGNELVFTIMPDEGFRIAFIIIDGTETDLATDENWDSGSGQYTFTDITEAHTIEVGFEVATALAEAKALQQLTVYPNPAKDELWVEFYHHGDAAVDIVLLNIHGQAIQQISVSASGSVRQRMATHGLTPGVYLLTIRSGEVFPVKKVVVEN